MNLLKYIFGILFGFGIVACEVFSKQIVSNVLYFGGAMGFLLVSILYLTYIYGKLTLEESVKYLSTFAFYALYYFTRISVAVIEPQFALKNFSDFSSYFSLGYAFAQFGVGFFIAKFGNRFIGILNFLASIFLMLTVFPMPFPVLVGLRIITGVCFAAGSMGFVINTNNVAKEKFNIMFFIAMFVGGKIASITNFLLASINSNSFIINWKSILIVPGIIGILLSIIIFFSEKKSITISTVEVESSFLDSFKDFLTHKNLILLTLFGAFCISPNYAFQTGMLAGFDKVLNLTSGRITSIFNDCSNYATIFMPFIVSIGLRLTILTTAICSVASVIILLLFQPQVTFPIIIACALLSGLGFAGHIVNSNYISQQFDAKTAAKYFPIINGFIMLIGSAFVQKLMGVCISYNGLRGVLIFLIGCTSISVISALAFFLSKDKKPQLNV